MSSSGTYGQLVSTTDATSDPIGIGKNKFTIGRKPTCDLSLAGNKLISGSHGFIEKDEEGKVWFHDTSTNGSLLNMSQKVNKDKVELKHGDEIHLVYRKADPAVNVAYLFQDLKKLDEEEADCTQEYSSDFDVPSDEEKNKISPVAKKRPAQTEEKEKTESEPALKKQKTGEVDEMKEGDSKLSKEEEQKPKQDVSGEKKESTEVTTKPQEAGGGCDAFEESLICIICQEILHDCISLQPCMHSFCSGCYSDWMERSRECPSCRMNVDRINKNHIVNNLVDAYLKQNPGKKRPEEDIKELDAKNKITRDMLYPGKKKRKHEDCSDDDEDEYDEDDESVEDSDVPSDSDDGGIQPPIFNMTTPTPALGFGLGPLAIPTMPMHLVHFPPRPPKSVCRQCAEYTGPHPTHGDGNKATTLGTAAAAVGSAVSKVVGLVTGTKTNSDKGAAEPSTSAGAATSKDSDEKNLPDVKINPTPPVFTCTPYQTHILCNCCMQPMPDRRHLANIPGNNAPPIQCAVCSRAFCHAYWGCMKGDCMGCIGKFGELNFGKRALTGLILDNVYESEVFKKYIEMKEWSVKDLLRKCLAKLESKHYTCPDQNRYRIDSTQVLCYACGLRNFKELAYQFRRDIPKSELPAEVTARSDCYWGRNCRTARNKPHHAQRFNHICDQTRTGM